MNKLLSISVIGIWCATIQTVFAQTSLQPLPSYSWQATQPPGDFNGKFQFSFVSANQGFPDYGSVLAGGGYSGGQDGGAFQLYFPYSSQYGGSVPMVRLGRYNNQGWTVWQSFYTSANANKENIDWKAKNLVVYGKIGIGITNPDEELAVNGSIRAQQIKVEIANWPDYVFKNEYDLMSLPETERYINTHGHLPELQSGEIFEAEGISLGDMDKILLKKIEELTLHLIEKDKKITEIERKLEQLLNTSWNLKE